MIEDLFGESNIAFRAFGARVVTDDRLAEAGSFSQPDAAWDDGLKHLVSLVGPSQVRLLMYTGMRIDAAEAARIGLIDRMVPAGDLWAATMDIATTIAGNAPLAVQAAKITIAEVLKDPGSRDMEAIRRIGTACMDSEDFREGRRAFMEKRKPRFVGK